MAVIQEATVIINPAAGYGHQRAEIEGHLRWLTSAGWRLELRWTREPGHATQLAQRAYWRGTRCFISVGGDGTAFEIVNGLMALRQEERFTPPHLGLLPFGHGNSLLRSFDLTTPELALQALLRQREQPLDLIYLQHSQGELFAVNYLTLGLPLALLGHAPPLSYPLRLGELLYAALRAKPMALSWGVDAEPLATTRCDLMAVCNTPHLGRRIVAPAAALDDGHLELLQVGPWPAWRWLLAASLWGEEHFGQRAARGLEARRCRQIALASAPLLPLIIDGERRELQLQRLTILPKAITLLA